MKQIVDGIVEEENVMQIIYPVGDNYLQVCIPEESKGLVDKVKQMTTLNLETYEV